MGKRQFRELDTLDPTIRQRISASLSGKPKTEQHKQRLSQSMKDYWAHIPSKSSLSYFDDENNKEETTND